MSRTVVKESEELCELSFSQSETGNRPRRFSGRRLSRVAITAPPAVVPPPVRCQVVETGATKRATTTEKDEDSTRTDDVRTTRFIPRPAVPTLSKAEILLKKAEDISYRGNPCISRQYAEEKYQRSVWYWLDALVALMFLPRDAVLARYWLWPFVCLSVCLSVCPSQVGVLSKRLNRSSSFWHRGYP